MEMRLGCTSSNWSGSFEPGRLEFCPLAAPAGCVSLDLSQRHIVERIDETQHLGMHDDVARAMAITVWYLLMQRWLLLQPAWDPERR